MADFLVVIVLLLFINCFAVAVIANKCDRNGAAWFLVSLFFTPIMAVLMLIAVGRPTAEEREKSLNKLRGKLPK